MTLYVFGKSKIIFWPNLIFYVNLPWSYIFPWKEVILEVFYLNLFHQENKRYKAWYFQITDSFRLN